MITIADVEAAIENANQCLYSVFPNYKEPDNITIWFTKAESYWAKISRSTCKLIGNYLDFDIRIGNLFNQIPTAELKKLRLEECMIHELIHTIPRCNNHGPNFKRVAEKINNRYPQYNIQTQTDASKYGLPEAEIKKLWEFKCKDCGKVYYYGKKPRYSADKYCCGKCGKKSLELFKL